MIFKSGQTNAFGRDKLIEVEKAKNQLENLGIALEMQSRAAIVSVFILRHLGAWAPCLSACECEEIRGGWGYVCSAVNI